MGDSMNKILSIVLILAFISQGNGECPLTNLTVSQGRTGREVEGKAELIVILSNHCLCDMSKVVLTCPGFRSITPVDPSLFRVSGDRCIVNNGGPIYARDVFRFTYVWDRALPLTPITAQINCPQA